MSYISQVAEFHRAFAYRQPEPRLPDLHCKATNELRPKLLREELQELMDGIAANDRVDQLDALCDYQYVLSGAVLAWGLRGLYESLSWPHKPRPIHDLRACIIAQWGFIEEMEVCAQGNFPAQLIAVIHYAQNDLFRLVEHLGFSDVFPDAFAEVHRSNMSKLWDVPDYKAEDVFKMDATVNGKWIARRGDGKIIKSPTYSPAQLAQFVK